MILQYEYPLQSLLLFFINTTLNAINFPQSNQSLNYTGAGVYLGKYGYLRWPQGEFPLKISMSFLALPLNLSTMDNDLT